MKKELNKLTLQDNWHLNECSIFLHILSGCLGYTPSQIYTSAEVGKGLWSQ